MAERKKAYFRLDTRILDAMKDKWGSKSAKKLEEVLSEIFKDDLPPDFELLGETRGGDMQNK